MNIQHEESGNKGRFYVHQEGKDLAEMTYVFAGDTKIIIDHTEVDDALRGRGAGKNMVEKAVVYARGKNHKILPLCPFAKSVFDKTLEYSDVL